MGQEDVRSFNFAEWWPDLATDVCDLVRDYPLPDFKSYRHDEHYKNTALGDEDIPDSASLSDSSSCHSYVPSDTSPSSSASSAHGIDPSHKGAGMFAQLMLTKDRADQDQVTSGTHSTSSTEHPHGFVPKRKIPPAKPGTVAEIIDATNTDRISKVMLESKLFKVWHHERTVLIGDACHKVLPFAGQGAIQAILDGISLANALYDMKSNSIEDITKAFKRYSGERIPIARAAVVGSQSFGKLLNVQGRLSDFIRKISFSRVPDWALKMATDKLHLHRPQLTFLPMVPDRGSAKAHKQQYSPRYMARLIHDQQILMDRQRGADERVADPSTATKGQGEEARADDKHRGYQGSDSLHNGHHHFQNREQHPNHNHHPHHHHHHNHHHEPERRHGRHEHGHHEHDNRRHRPPSLSSNPSSSRNSSARFAVPPPLPLEASPRHHPLQHPLDERIEGLPTPSYSCSATSSPSSSSFTLVGGMGYEDAHVHSPTRPRRHTVNHKSRSQPTSPRKLSREMSLPPFLYDTHDHRVVSQKNVSRRRGHNDSNEFLPQLFTPPRSPSISTPPVGPLTISAPISSQYKDAHQRTMSLQPELSLNDTIVALEQTTAMMKKRFGLREQRSLDQIRPTFHGQTKQRH